MIGQDFPKIRWDIFDLQLLEPNAMFGDIVLFSMSLFFAVQIRKMNKTQPFLQYWRLFFVWFGRIYARICKSVTKIVNN
jgi:hypothetical protein